VQFIDQARILVRAGRGGDGIVAFRREKYVPAGGPSGGDGGRGGDVVLVADANLQTLLDFKYQRLFAADDGVRGGPNRRSGPGGRPLRIRVPCGTEVRDARTTILLGDLTEPGQELVVAHGGRGGLGNAHYLSNRNRAPEKYTEGRTGEEWQLQLELKLLAEVGIIGLPNAGKSTLIAVLSAARPKIADYPFTTLAPNLGIVDLSPEERFVMADIPGLIEGASEGAGLGTRFLGHVERTAVLIHLVDCTRTDVAEAWRTVRRELEAYGAGLGDKSEILALSKVDALDPDTLQMQKEALEAAAGRPVSLVSGVSGQGVRDLLREAWRQVQARRAEAKATGETPGDWRP
jgi:GTP-binding protein